MTEIESQLFESISWTKELLGDPAYVSIPTPSRLVKWNTEDKLTGETLKTAETIGSWLMQYKKPDLGQNVVETRTFLSLGAGVNGYPHIAHGGFLGVLFDEAMGLLLMVNNSRGEVEIGRPDDSSQAMYTASLKMDYLKPIATPQIVLVRVKLGKKRGRKVIINGFIEDAKGHVLTKAEALWIAAKEPTEKL